MRGSESQSHKVIYIHDANVLKMWWMKTWVIDFLPNPNQTIYLMTDGIFAWILPSTSIKNTSAFKYKYSLSCAQQINRSQRSIGLLRYYTTAGWCSHCCATLTNLLDINWTSQHEMNATFERTIEGWASRWFACYFLDLSWPTRNGEGSKHGRK